MARLAKENKAKRASAPRPGKPAKGGGRTESRLVGRAGRAAIPITMAICTTRC